MPLLNAPSLEMFNDVSTPELYQVRNQLETLTLFSFSAEICGHENKAAIALLRLVQREIANRLERYGA